MQRPVLRSPSFGEIESLGVEKGSTYIGICGGYCEVKYTVAHLYSQRQFGSNYIYEMQE